ncbi:hypothetical protein GCM10022261_30930 [Brevibacterium daeguense]|uniref:Uncharacterized protein n=1 Tax=Brevibacterium daeguense TaxID=909936 RepID=A0ABP8EP27_9MICO|nr:hypothetical protein [Brevibacterium daeguense]
MMIDQLISFLIVAGMMFAPVLAIVLLPSADRKSAYTEEELRELRNS